jgi:hypothetical protein
MTQKIKFFLISLILLLTINSCKEKNNSITSNVTINQLKLEGHISGLNSGNNYTVKFKIPQYYFPDYYFILDSCQVDSSGNFSLIPGPVPDSLTNPIVADNSNDNSFISDTTTRFLYASYPSAVYVYSNVSKLETGVVWRMKKLISNYVYVGWFYTTYIYVNKNVDIHGYGTTAISLYVNEYHNLSLKRGWNKISRKLMSVVSGDVYESASEEPPGAEWIYQSNTLGPRILTGTTLHRQNKSFR